MTTSSHSPLRLSNKVAESQIPSKPMFLSDQFEAYLNLFDADIGNRVQRCVDAQELHQKLGVGNDFTTWVKSRIVQEALEEKVDYLHLKTQVQVPHQGGQRSVNKSVYTLTLETAKIIAAMERNETGRKIRKWLVRVEEQARQTHTTPAPQISRLEVARELVAALEREEAAREEAARLTHTIASNVLIPRPAYKENAEGIALQRIKREIAPYLSVKVIAHVLKHFGQKRTYVQYGGHENQVVKPFVREGVENAITQFLDQAERRVSYSRKSVVLTHDCLLGDEALVSAEDAVEYLGYSPDDFGLAAS